MGIRSTGYAAIVAGSLLLASCSHKENKTPIAENKTADTTFVVNKVPNVTKPYEVDSTARVLCDAWTSIMEKEGHKVNLTSAFFQKVIDFSKEVKTDPIDLTFIMYQESKFQSTAQSPAGKYAGLIQMDKTAFQDCAIRMMEYNKYAKENPDVSLLQYLPKIANNKITRPDIGSKRITYDTYRHLSPEKQFDYSMAYLNYRIHEKGLNNKRIPSNQLWALIHRPADCRKADELSGRAKLLNAVKYGSSQIKGVREISPKDFYRIMKLKV